MSPVDTVTDTPGDTAHGVGELKVQSPEPITTDPPVAVKLVAVTFRSLASRVPVTKVSVEATRLSASVHVAVDGADPNTQGNEADDPPISMT